MRRAREQPGLTALLAVALLVIALTGGALVIFVRFGGYCGSDLLPVNTALRADPYVQDLSSTAVTVMWRTTDDEVGLVAYGETPALGQSVASQAARVHEVRLTGLRADTDYFYQVRSGGTVSAVQAFRTPPDPSQVVTGAVVGDTGSGEQPQMEVAELLLGLSPDLVLHTGDVVYPRGGECHYDDRYYDPYRSLIGSVPVYPVLGNHDVRTANGEPFLTAFALPASSSGTERYYSFDFGALHVTALNSELYYDDDALSPAQQKEWLRRDLQATDRPWKIVVIHRPPFNSSPYHGGDPRVLEDLVTIFEEEGVDVVFSGHEHVYERLKPVAGVTYVVTGGGGAELRGAGTSERTIVSTLRYHALELTADSSQLVVEAIDTDGEVFDRFELRQ